MLVKIKRQKDSESQPYWQTFETECPEGATVAAMLDRLNYRDDLFDTEGREASRIHWECSCMQKICGACAMVINGRPSLACDTFIRDLGKDVLVLEPLSKFPVVCDLVVDRSIIESNLQKAGIYHDIISRDNSQYEQQYDVAKCLKCGLCLEVCPNYTKGENFYGALFANETYLVYSQSENKKKELKKKYEKNFASGCSKALSCQEVCPMHISTLSSMLKMNK